MGSNSSRNILPYIENLDFIPFFKIVFNKKYKLNGVCQLLNHYDIITLIYVRKVLIRHLSTSIHLNTNLFNRLSNIVYYLNKQVNNRIISMDNEYGLDLLTNDNSITAPPPYD